MGFGSFASAAATVFAAVFLVSLPAVPTAQAAVIFQDTFDAEAAPGFSALDYSPLANWTIGGTVDLISHGGFSIACAGSAGKCLDMDGTSGGVGTITTNLLFAAGTYVLNFDISGNQRLGSADTLQVTFGDLDETFARSPSDPFGTITRTVTVGPGGASLQFAQLGPSDQLGIILDNVIVSDSEATAIPAPGAAAILALGLMVLGRRRRKPSA